MASSALKPGVPITLRELEPSSDMFKQGASLRVTGNLQSYDVDFAISVIQDGSVSLKVDTQHLRDISFRTNSTYQFIGELLIQPDNYEHHSPSQLFISMFDTIGMMLHELVFASLQAILQARVGRNVDGLDLNLYQQSLLIRRQYEAKLRSSRRAWSKAVEVGTRLMILVQFLCSTVMEPLCTREHNHLTHESVLHFVRYLVQTYKVVY